MKHLIDQLIFDMEVGRAWGWEMEGGGGGTEMPLGQLVLTFLSVSPLLSAVHACDLSCDPWRAQNLSQPTPHRCLVAPSWS